MKYTVTYDDGADISVHDSLAVNSSEKIKVHFEYLESENKTDYPTEDISYECSISLSYAQGEGTARKISGVIYRYTNDNLFIGDSIVATEGTHYKITDGQDVLPLRFVSLAECEQAYNAVDIDAKSDYYCEGEPGIYGGLSSYTRDASTLNKTII